QRPATGRWAGMWQFVTLVAQEGAVPRASLEATINSRTGDVKPLGIVTHALTHRRYEFTVFGCAVDVAMPAKPPRTWATLAEIERLPLSKPQLKVAEFARAAGL